MDMPRPSPENHSRTGQQKQNGVDSVSMDGKRKDCVYCGVIEAMSKQREGRPFLFGQTWHIGDSAKTMNKKNIHLLRLDSLDLLYLASVWWLKGKKKVE